MTVKCRTHDITMTLVPSGISKRTGKRYKAFYGCPNYDCKETAPATDEVDAFAETKSFEEEINEGDYTSQLKNEAQQKLNQVESSDEDEYRPPKRREWAYKEYNKSLSIISSDYRSEGMSPMQAVETGNLWQWMDFFHLNDEFYPEWKEAKRKVYREILDNEK